MPPELMTCYEVRGLAVFGEYWGVERLQKHVLKAACVDREIENQLEVVGNFSCLGCCLQLASITFQEELGTIVMGPFGDYQLLIEIIIKECIEMLGEYVFEKCVLTSFTDFVTDISKQAVADCLGLKTLKFGENWMRLVISLALLVSH